MKTASNWKEVVVFFFKVKIEGVFRHEYILELVLSFCE